METLFGSVPLGGTMTVELVLILNLKMFVKLGKVSKLWLSLP